MSKIEQGRKLYHPRPQPLAPVLRTAVRTIDYPLRQQGFSLRVDIDDALPDALIDGDALEQAVLNLIGNAIKYSGTGREIGVVLVREGDWAVIRVVDGGVGIPPGDRERIFEKYYRVPSPQNSEVPGTGLGLTLVSILPGSTGAGSRSIARRAAGARSLSICPGGPAVKRILIVRNDVAILRGLKDNLNSRATPCSRRRTASGLALAKEKHPTLSSSRPDAAADGRLRCPPEAPRGGVLSSFSRPAARLTRSTA
jgi:hypothetical protein